MNDDGHPHENLTAFIKFLPSLIEAAKIILPLFGAHVDVALANELRAHLDGSARHVNRISDPESRIDSERAESLWSEVNRSSNN